MKDIPGPPPQPSRRQSSTTKPSTQCTTERGSLTKAIFCHTLTVGDHLPSPATPFLAFDAATPFLVGSILYPGVPTAFNSYCFVGQDEHRCNGRFSLLCSPQTPTSLISIMGTSTSLLPQICTENIALLQPFTKFLRMPALSLIPPKPYHLSSRLSLSFSSTSKSLAKYEVFGNIEARLLSDSLGEPI